MRPASLGMFWQTMNDNVGYRRKWDQLGITKTMFQWVAVDGSSFIPSTSLPAHIRQLNLADINSQPWASQIVIGLPGINNETNARSGVAGLVTLAEEFAGASFISSHYPANSIGNGFYFPIEIDPSWTNIDSVFTTALWNRLRALPGTLYVSVYYGDSLTSLGITSLQAANWVNTHIPSDVTVLFQDGVGAHGVSVNTAVNRYAELQSVLGANRVELIAEAFRINPGYVGVTGTYYIPATAEQIRGQLYAYRNFKTWLFDGPSYINTKLIQEVLYQVPVLPPDTLASGVYSTGDIKFTWNRTSQAGASVSGYEIYVYDLGGNNILRTLTSTGTSVTYTAAQSFADFGTALTYTVFRVSEVSTTGFVSDKSAQFAATATSLPDPVGTYGVIMTGGQSNMDQHFGSLSQTVEGRSYLKIISEAETALGRSPGDITMINGATGGSAAEYRARPSWGPTLWWINTVTNADGPMLTAWIAKYNALPNGTNVIGVIWAQGEADVTANAADVNTSTPAMYKAALEAIFARMRAVVGNPNLKIWIQPLAISYWNYGANGLDITGNIYEAYRDQQIAIAYEQANTYIGAWKPNITYDSFVQEYDGSTPIAGRIHYTPAEYHALATKLGQAIGGNIDQIDTRPAWATLRAPTNIVAQFDAANNITITWTARPGVTQWHVINSKLDGTGFWSQGVVNTNSFTYTVAQQVADYGFGGVQIGIYIAEYSGSVMGNHGRFVGSPNAYVASPSPSPSPSPPPAPAPTLSAVTGLSAIIYGNDVVFSWTDDTAVDFEVVNFSTWNGAEISRAVITTNSLTFTQAQQIAYYGSPHTTTRYAVRKVKVSTSEFGPWSEHP